MANFKENMGIYPFKPEDKKPALLRQADYLHFLYPPNNAYTSDNNYLCVSTDTMLVGIYELGPGGSFDPIDIHPGDECYYILKGPIVQKSSLGQYLQAETNDGLYIPQESWHKGSNFTSEKARILFFIAPKAWDEHVPPAVFPKDEDTKMYKGINNDKLPNMSGRAGIKVFPTTDDIGHWPVDGPSARQYPQSIYRISEENKLVTIHGTKQPTLMKFTVSNDYMNMGEFIIPAGGTGPRCSDIDSHGGDCLLYCCEGPMTINICDTLEAFTMEPGDSFFIPGGTNYQMCNFEGKPIRAIFCIAPAL